MAQTPMLKVYVRGEYVASCKHPEDAAAILSANGDPTGNIRCDHRLIVWREGCDGQAGDSYDAVAALIERRLLEIKRVVTQEIRRAKQSDLDAIKAG